MIGPIPSTSTTAGLALFLLFVGLATVAVVWGRFRRVRVPRPHRWGARGPRLWVAPSSDAEVDGAKLDEAIAWWQQRGHDVGWAANAQTATCEVLVDRTIDQRASAEQAHPTHYDLTRRWLAPSGLVIRAEIRTLPGPDALLLAHAIGHALGYEHPRAAPSGHLLHPTRPGWNGRGLEGP